ncbi:hypothetical protein KI688_001241 [Linnemannia hyalina]|uniref:Uncharacterized protein n=1 Tax=Linnemannia hyalina TaxID=64524 RepID=A0A9P7XSV0_9FUNG|nr:hypothetical protein KI688_001241 [Linnemannia hyalina]
MVAKRQSSIASRPLSSTEGSMDDEVIAFNEPTEFIPDSPQPLNDDPTPATAEPRSPPPPTDPAVVVFIVVHETYVGDEEKNM